MIYAVVKASTVVNIVEAEPDTALDFIFPEADFILPMTETSGYPIIGNQVSEGIFQPWASWTWQSKSKSWEPPTPKPSGSSVYVWLETTLEWVEFINEGLAGS